MRFLRECLRENFSSPLTYIASVVFAVFCVAGVTVRFGDVSYSFVELAFDEKISAEVANTISCSSAVMAKLFSSSNWYSIWLAVLTAIPPLYTYKRTIEKNCLFSLIRTDYKSYSAGVVVSTFVGGAIITLAGILLYIAAAYLFFPSFDSFSDPIYQVIYGTAAERTFVLIKKVVNHAIVGGIIPVFTIVLYRFIHSDFLAATIPMMLMYVSVIILPNFREWATWKIKGSKSAPLQLLAGFFPSNLPELEASFSSLNAPFWAAYIVLGAMLFGLYFMFYKSIKKV